MPGLVLAIEDIKMKETLVPISFASYQNAPRLSVFKEQPFILLTILWVNSLIWAPLGGSSDLGWAHLCVCFWSAAE